ncbi:ABC-type branched-subunit amino acid transport system ATPase component/branched-subunit amino acid ABC-type transport system permease component [Bradyrhizobium sp. i1.4.4]
MTDLLKLSGVHTHIGRYHILQGIDLAVPQGQTTMLLGRNGAGKTTTLRTVMGLWQASSGEITLAGERIESRATPDIARLGVGYVPESMAVFSDLTVKENLVLAARDGPLDDTQLDWIFGFFPALRRFWLSRAGSLSGGQKQMLSIARAIVEPRKLLLIDEPTKGLAPAIVMALIECLKEIERKGATILMVEQNFFCRPRARRQRAGHGQRHHRPSRRDGGARRRRAAAGAAARPEPGGASVTELAANDPLPKPKRDLAPILLPVALALAMIPLVGSPSTWLTLTAASLAMGMMIFIMASGLTLVFGLMDVLNFGHGAFIAVGAYVATLVLAPFAASMQADSLWTNLAVLAPAALLSMAVSGALGLVVERVLILPVYGQHLKQILMTTGGLIVAEQTLYALWGPQIIPTPLPTSLRGSFILGDVAIAKYRVLAMLVGLAVFIAIQLVLNRTKLGLLIRAGVENREMVEALGYRIRRLFLGVFMTGSALAGLGGVMWALYREQVHASMSDDLTVLIFIVVIIGGLGSIGGCFIGAILVAMVANYGGFLVPKLALVSNILLMVAILMWRPRGLYAVTSR